MGVLSLQYRYRLMSLHSKECPAFPGSSPMPFAEPVRGNCRRTVHELSHQSGGRPAEFREPISYSRKTCSAWLSSLYWRAAISIRKPGGKVFCLAHSFIRSADIQRIISIYLETDFYICLKILKGVLSRSKEGRHRQESFCSQNILLLLCPIMKRVFFIRFFEAPAYLSFSFSNISIGFGSRSGRA